MGKHNGGISHNEQGKFMYYSTTTYTGRAFVKKTDQECITFPIPPLYLCLRFSFYLSDFLSIHSLSFVGGSLRIKSFIAKDGFTASVVHMTIKDLIL